MLDTYLDGVNYFRLVLANDTSRTSRDSAHRLDELANGTSGTSRNSSHRLDELPLRHHGVIVEMDSSSATLAAILFGSQHFDIFGWFLPLESPTLESASATVCDIYISRNMSRVLRDGSDVTNGVRWNTNVDQNLSSTLDRYSNTCCMDVKLVPRSLRNSINLVIGSPKNSVTYCHHF